MCSVLTGLFPPMTDFLVLLMRCMLVVSLAFVPVANAMNMAAMAASQESEPACHAHSQSQQNHDAAGSHAASQCHCAMAICLPAAATSIKLVETLTDHPQTVLRLAIGQASVPEIPPPQRLL